MGSLRQFFPEYFDNFFGWDIVKDHPVDDILLLHFVWKVAHIEDLVIFLVKGLFELGLGLELTDVQHPVLVLQDLVVLKGLLHCVSASVFDFREALIFAAFFFGENSHELDLPELGEECFQLFLVAEDRES